MGNPSAVQPRNTLAVRGDSEDCLETQKGQFSMKRFALATLAALAAVVASEQQAKAWFNFGVGGGFNTNISWGGNKRCGTESEGWPTTSLGVPQFNNYGQGPWGIPNYPYGMPMPGGHGAPYVAPMPGSGSGAGSGSPVYFVPTVNPYYGYVMPYTDGV